MLCPYCKEEIADGAIKCKHCSSMLTAQQKEFAYSNMPKDDEQYCVSCAAVIKKAAQLCPKCGVANKNAAIQGEKNKLAAALFGIFLGGIGIHKFYLGQVGMGIVYLVFFWTCIPAIIGFIEGIIYLTLSDEKFNEKYN